MEVFVVVFGGISGVFFFFFFFFWGVLGFFVEVCHVTSTTHEVCDVTSTTHMRCVMLHTTQKAGCYQLSPLPSGQITYW